MAGATIEFRFDEAADERRFLREYLLDAWDRFEASDDWEAGWYWPYGQFEPYDAGPDGGLVRLVFDGDPDGIVDRERDAWAAFDGLDDWTLKRYEETDPGYESLLAQQRDAKGAVGGEREYRLKQLTARFALAYRDEFDDPLAPAGETGGAGPLANADEPADDDPIGIGLWTLYHDLTVQCGYDWYDETDACLRAIQNRLKSIASYRGAEAARAEYDRLRSELDAYEDEFEAWLDEHPTGESSEP